MKIKHYITCIIALLFMTSAFAQNAFDENGDRTGKWKGYYPNQMLRYEATFENGKPLGLMKRYHQDGYLNANMYFYKGGDRCRTKMLNPSGELIAEGIYDNKLKDSIWSYFDSQGNKTLEESYKLGILNGFSRGYYPTGSLSQELYFNEGVKDGTWIQYFENGDTMLITNYKQGLLDGSYITYYPESILQSKGVFVDDVKDGEWHYFTEEGEEKNVLIYKMGELLNPEVMEESYERFIKHIEDNLDNVPDPAENL